MFQQIFLNNTLETWLISLAIIAGALLLNKLISLLNRKVILKLTGKTANRFDNILFSTLEAPLMLGIMLVALWVALNRLNIVEKNVKNILSESYQVLAILNITWFFAKLMVALIEEYLSSSNTKNAQRKVHLDIHMIALSKKTVLFVIWILGGVIALSNIGINIGALLGTLGIGGVAVALAAQDTVKNIFGGFTILMDGTFRIGDRIKIGEFDGFVENIGIRSTRIRNFDKRIITIPNYKIVEGAVENISEAPSTRVVMSLGLSYSTTTNKMQLASAILKQTAEEFEHIDKDNISVAFSEFAATSMNLKFTYFISKDGDNVKIPSDINFKILERFNSSGIEFAVQPQSVITFKS